MVPALPPLSEAPRAMVVEYLRSPNIVDALGPEVLVYLCAGLCLVFVTVALLFARLNLQVKSLKSRLNNATEAADELSRRELEADEVRRRSGVATLELGLEVSSRLNAVWYQRKLAALQDAMSKRGYRFSASHDDEPNGLSFLPHDVLQEVSEAVMVARTAHCRPRDADSDHKREAASALQDGFAQMLVNEMIEALWHEGFAIEFFGRTEQLGDSDQIRSEDLTPAV